MSNNKLYFDKVLYGPDQYIRLTKNKLTLRPLDIYASLGSSIDTGYSYLIL